MKAFVKALTVLVAIAAIGGVVAFFLITSRGVSARSQPGWFETTVARAMRSAAVPRGGKDRKNPLRFSDEVFASAKEHWADHCASCHSNDGSGQTSIGLGLYPKAPDMRLPATQSLSDGELFYIIEHGVRFTGMPAWGTGDAAGEESSWQLVQFIRELPHLAPDQRTRIEALMPRSPDEIRQEILEQQFLNGQ